MDHKERLKRAVEYAKKEGSFSKINMAEKADIVCAWGVGKFFEDAFEKVYQVSLNEAMILCALQEASPNNMTATSLSKRTELTPSHASKMLRILEEKELIVRTLGEEDRRLMQFHLSQSGKKLVRQLALEKVEIPELLKPLFESVDS